MGYASKVASLTTISTPHLGSEIVDYIFNKKYLHTRLAKRITYSLAKLYGDKSPSPHQMLGDLTSESMMKFNRNNPNNELVYYCSYYSLLKNKYDDLSHFFTYNFIEKESGGPNDGIVSRKSSGWGGESHILIEGKNGGISHSEIIDIKRKKISGVEIPDEYLKIVQSLALKGF